MSFARQLCTVVAALLPALPAAAAELTATESRWLRGALPVLEHAQREGWPLDIVVQPQETPGLPPLATAFVGGRCKFVLSMRGNAEAEAALARIPGDLADAAIELMAAHELGHCSRHLAGRWQQLPPGAAGDAARLIPAALRPALHADWARMQAVRREEAFADLVALGWAQQRHAARYERLRDWLMTERSRDLIPASHHDTLAWLKLAHDGHALALQRSPFAADALWAKGFLSAE